MTVLWNESQWRWKRNEEYKLKNFASYSAKHNISAMWIERLIEVGVVILLLLNVSEGKKEFEMKKKKKINEDDEMRNKRWE